MPLKGLKVLEFSGLAPLPFVGNILADFGANVTILQKNDFLIDTKNLLNGGKKSICINLKHPEGIKIARKLSTECDILLEPYRPGIMEKLGLGPDELIAKNPHLIYARLNGYGSYGIYSQKGGHDINYLGLSGLLSLYGSKNPKPVPPVNFSEFSGSLSCVIGILLAIIERYKSGNGQVVDTNITEAIAYTGSWLFSSQYNSLIWGKPKGQNLLDGGMHFYDTYETKDGKWMAVGALEPKFYSDFIEGLGLDTSDIEQMNNFESNRKIIAKVFKEKTRDEWCKIFDSKDACVTPVLDFDEVDQHPHNISRNSFVRENNVVLPVPSPKLSKTPGVSSVNKPVAFCGQHNTEILTSIGFTQIEIDRLKKDNIIFEEPKFKI